MNCLLPQRSNGRAAEVRVRELGQKSVDWRTDQITRLVGGGSHEFVTASRVVTLDAEQSLGSLSFDFDVDDRYAFDNDDPVHLEVEFNRRTSESRANLDMNASSRPFRVGRSDPMCERRPS